MKLTPNIKSDILKIIIQNDIQSITTLLKEVVVLWPNIDQIEVIDFWNKEIKVGNR